MSVTKSSTCCRCLRWYKREELTENNFCLRCVGAGSLRGSKCRWCRGNLAISDGEREPNSATCENCAKLQLRYGPPQHCMLCKLEASFKTKRGSRVCRRCDYCLKNYGKPKSCQKCKVKAAWDGAKIEQINDLCLCFICTFREKRKSKVVEPSSLPNKENDKKNGDIPATPPPATILEKPAVVVKPKLKPKPIDPTVQLKNSKAPKDGKYADGKTVIEYHIGQVESGTNTVLDVLEDIELIDEHTSASLQVNELTQKIKEMNAELSKRKKIIEDKDNKISALKGLLTSKMLQHEQERRIWESRLTERISDFKSKLHKCEAELSKLREEKKKRKKKIKEKKMAKQTTMVRKDAKAVHQELFNNSLKRPVTESPVHSGSEFSSRKRKVEEPVVTTDPARKKTHLLPDSSDDDDADDNISRRKIEQKDSDDDEKAEEVENNVDEEVNSKTNEEAHDDSAEIDEKPTSPEVEPEVETEPVDKEIDSSEIEKVDKVKDDSKIKKESEKTDPDSKKTDQNDEDEEPENEPEQRNFDADSDDDDVEAALKEIDEEEKENIDDVVNNPDCLKDTSNSSDSATDEPRVAPKTKEIKEFSSSSDSETPKVLQKNRIYSDSLSDSGPEGERKTPKNRTTTPKKRNSPRPATKNHFSSSESEDENDRRKPTKLFRTSPKNSDDNDDEDSKDQHIAALVAQSDSDLLNDLRQTEMDSSSNSD